MRIGSFPYRPGDNPYQRLFTEAIESAGATVVRIPPRKVLPIHWALSHPIDLLHIDWPHDFYRGRNAMLTRVKRLMYWLGCRRLRRFPVVWTAHNVVAHDSPSPEFDRRMLQQLVDCCDGIVAMSNAAANALRETYRIAESTRIEVIPHGHYIDAYVNQIDPAKARQRLDISASAKVVLFLGRIRAYKGVEDLIAAFQAIHRSDAVLLIAGEPVPESLGVRLRKLAKNGLNAETIRFHFQTVPADELQIYLNACDVVALPFRNILNSGSLLLALSFGRCVIAPNLGSIPEVAPDYAHVRYDPSDADGLTTALCLAIDSDDLIERGASAKTEVETTCDWSAIGRQLAGLYTEILASRQAV